jgi:DNA-binding IclR family transcriptional regulator
VIELLEQVGRAGLNAGLAVEMAEAEGRELDRGSTSSLLSRLKADGTVEYDGDRYRLSSVMKVHRDREQDDREGLQNVHPHPASGRAMPS